MQRLKYALAFVGGACLPIAAALVFLKWLSYDRDGILQ